MTASQQPAQLPPPPLMWAQRANIVLVTVNLEDCKDTETKFEKDSFYFKGTGGVDKKAYEVTVPLYKEIDPENSQAFNRGRCIEIVLTKAEENQPYWPSLTKDKKKHHYIKCDFNKWQDEDDSGDENMMMDGPPGGGKMDMEALMRNLGGLGGGGAGDRPSLDDLNGEGDSDDEDLPELE